MLLLCQTGIQLLRQLLFVEVLANENNLDHAIAILLIPVAHQARLLLHQLDQILLRRSRIPKTRL